MEGAKKLKMDHDDGPKNADFFPPIPKSEGETEIDGDDGKVYNAVNKHPAVEIWELKNENEKLRVVIRGLLVETGRNPDHLDHLLTRGVQNHENLDDNFKTVNQLTAKKALSTSVVLRKIFGYLDDLNLLEFRRVCKLWAEEASAYLRIFKEPTIGQSFEKVPRAVSVQLSYNSAENTLGKNGVGTLSNLVKLMDRGCAAGQKFPCSRFSITCPNLLPTVVPDAVELLEKFGYLMNSLVVEFVNLPNSPLTIRHVAESLRNLLFKWAPNLKHFRFEIRQWSQDGDPVPLLNDENSSSSLPNLQILDWYNTSSSGLHLYKDILKISPNLKNLSSLHIKEVVEANKTDLVKEVDIYFSATCPSPTGKLILESEHCTKVEKLRIGYCLDRGFSTDYAILFLLKRWRPNVQLLNRILYNNRNSLTEIQFQNLGPLVDRGLEVPVMPNVKTLGITTDFESRILPAFNNPWIYDFFRIFPEGLDVASTFPKLALISWNIKIKEDLLNPLGAPYDFLELPVLDTMGPLTSVRSLTFQFVDKKHVEFLKRIALCLPNVRKLTVDYNETINFATFYEHGVAGTEPGVPKILRIIWDLFQGLEEIHLVCFLKDAPEGVFLKDTPAQLVDSAITGLDLATVNNLAGSGSGSNKFSGKSENLEEIRDKDPKAVSILKMKRLRYLKISLQSKNDFPLLSHVASTHGFGRLSNLTVVIEAKGEKSSVIDDPKGLMSRNVKFTQVTRKQKSK